MYNLKSDVVVANYQNKYMYVCKYGLYNIKFGYNKYLCLCDIFFNYLI